ncbi:helix-turn-helix domain-containing protein [Streptomyces hoynatensis]|uniref:XRE family transcriptional regulator n=1 Tax=Streptomyces hoynatensis TaxID=1141874 RepID=A0A3A9YYR9_9ACTN|nr:helix-turn-helix transcriptional regulator [Streptomyces hoynatensis]RKN40387.1 XRE family transcriptional regulator [Streptomyces hoynatensis]
MPATFGDRLQKARKRAGLSQRTLAAESGVSLSLIRKLEQGERHDTRLETARRLAAALHVPTTLLISAEATDADPADGDRAAPWAAVHAALDPDVADSRDLDEAPTVEGVRAGLDLAIAHYTSGNLAAIAAFLPGLIQDVNALAGLTDRGRPLRMEVMQITGRLMTQTRNYAAAEVAFGLAQAELPDELHAAALANNTTWLLLRRGRLKEAGRLAARWAETLEPKLSRATPEDLSAWGWLLLRTAATASRDSRPDDAAQALRLATAAAVTMPPPRPGKTLSRAGFIRRYTRLTVGMQRAEQAMVEERPEEVLRVARQVGAKKLPPTVGNRNRHLLDVAHAQVLVRQHADAMETLLLVERDAPEWLPHQRYAKEVLAQIIAKRRTLTGDMRRLADTMRLPL